MANVSAPNEPVQPTAYNLFWALVYANTALTYIADKYPQAYAECGDASFQLERYNLLTSGEPPMKD